MTQLFNNQENSFNYNKKRWHQCFRKLSLSYSWVRLNPQTTQNTPAHDIKNCFSFLLMQSDNELECGPMPNLMAALPNIGGALCSTPQSLADAHY